MRSLFFTFALLFTILIIGCKKDAVTTDSSKTVNFSTDTLFFDTVFSTIGSSTRKFKIYNKNNQAIKISSLRLAGGSNSLFRLNVNGVPGIEFKDLEIRAKDSMWVFADVTVDPQNSATPYIVKDSLLIETNGNKQEVKLIAFGQQAIFHKPTPGNSSFFLNCNETWTNDTPHVVYGLALIDTGCVLNIEKGTKVYFHSNGAIIALKEASLKINGTKSEPVVLQGDRLEPWYENVAGQWNGIYLFPLSVENEFNYAVIKNARTGIQCDTVNGSFSALPTLTLNNTVVQNASGIGLNARGTFIKAYNSMFINCGSYCAAFSLGGQYEAYHCTFGNYSPSSPDQSAIVLNNWFKDNNLNINPRDLEKADFYNCVIYGNQFNELTLSKDDGADFNFTFNNSLLKVNFADVDTTAGFTNCLFNKTPSFVNTSEYNFQLSNNSNAINIGDINTVNSNLIELEKDLLGTPRNIDSAPDAGAYEYITE